MVADKLKDNQELRTLKLAELVDHFAEIIQGEQLPSSKYIDTLKIQFSRKCEYIAKKEIAEEIEMADIQKERFQDLQARYDELNKKIIEERQALFCQRKEEIKALLGKFDCSLSMVGATFEQAYESYQAMAKAWQEIGELDPKDHKQLAKDFEMLREKFYKLEGGEEQKEADFKENKAKKEALLKQIEELTQHPSPKEANNEMNNLLKEWHYVGPVGNDDRQEILQRFKDLCYTINKRHQDFHSERISQEEMNYNAKTEVCIRLEELLSEEMPTSGKGWRELLSKVKELDKEYKDIEYSGRGREREVYQRFRAANDIFNQRRSQSISNNLAIKEENLRLKRELVEEARQMKDSCDWEETIVKYKELRERWKKIGFVPREYGDQVWDEFNEQCNHFFDRLKKEGPRRTAQLSRDKERYTKNIEAKQSVIQEFEALINGDFAGNEQEKVKELTERWRQTQFSKTSEATKLFERYKELQNTFYNKQKNEWQGNRLERYEAKIQKLLNNKEALHKEVKLLRFLEQKMETDLSNIEKNQSILNTNSRAGEKLLQQVQKKERKLKDELDFVQQRLKLIMRLKNN